MDYDHLQRSIVRIQSVGPKFDWFRPFLTSEGGTSLGSGFIVQAEPYLLIATNQHVINDAISVKIQLLLHSEQKWPVNVVAACPKFDLALLTLQDDAGFKEVLKKAGIEPKELPLSKEVAQMGEDVVALGFPLGQTSLKISKGNVAGNEVVNQNLCIQSTAPISPGNSGGPLLNADGTTIVGVNFAGATSGENINYVIPAWRVRALVNKHLKDQPSAPKNGTWERLGFKTADHGLLTQQPNAALFNASHGCKEGVFIGKVQDGFMAQAKPKVKVGSMLVSVNDRELDVFGTTPIEDLMMGRAHLDDLFFIKPNLEEEVPFTTCFHGKITKHRVNTSWTKKDDQGINYIDEPVIDERDKNYEMFGDIGVMDMTVNHVAGALQRGSSAQITRWLLADRIKKNRLMIIYVRPGSYATEVLPEGAAVEKLNGKEVRTLDEWREALVPDGKIWTLETDLGVVVAMPFEKTLTDQLKRSIGQPYVLTKGAQDAAQKLGYLKEVDASEEQGDDDSNDAKSSDDQNNSTDDKDEALQEEAPAPAPAASPIYAAPPSAAAAPAPAKAKRAKKAKAEEKQDDQKAKAEEKQEQDGHIADESDEQLDDEKAKADDKQYAKKADDKQDDKKADDKKDGDYADWSDDSKKDDDGKKTEADVKDDDAKSEEEEEEEEGWFGFWKNRLFNWVMGRPNQPMKAHRQAKVLLQQGVKHVRSHAKTKSKVAGPLQAVAPHESMEAMVAAGPLQVEVGPRGNLVARSSRVAHADELAAVMRGNL